MELDIRSIEREKAATIKTAVVIMVICSIDTILKMKIMGRIGTMGMFPAVQRPIMMILQLKYLQKQSPSFEREYNLKYLGLIGNVFHTKDIEAAIEKGRQYNPDDYKGTESYLLGKIL